MNQPLSYVHPGAKIANNVVIEPFVSIHKNTEIREGCWIGPNAVIMEGTRIGKNCQIFPGAVIGGIPQDLKFKGEDSSVEIGDNTVIREYVTINRGTAAKGITKVGNNCLIMSYCHIAHDCVVGNYVIQGSHAGLAGEVVVGDWVVISPYTAVHQFVNIGEHAFTMGGSLVGKDIPPYVKAGRNPLSYIGVNSIGLRRRNFTNEKITEIQNIYRIIFQKGYNSSQAIEVIEADLPASNERDKILLFLKNSKRGLMKGYTGTDLNE